MLGPRVAAAAAQAALGVLAADTDGVPSTADDKLSTQTIKEAAAVALGAAAVKAKLLADQEER